MGFWDSAEVSIKIGIILGVLVSIILGLGLIKVIINKRRFAKHTRHQELEDAGKDDVIQLRQRELSEGDISGVRAIERGVYGGVAGSSRNSLDNSQWTTRNTDILHTGPNDLSGTTVGSLEISTPSEKRLTLGFGPIQISKFHINDYLEESQQNNGSQLPTLPAKPASVEEFESRPKLQLSLDSKKNTASEVGHIATTHLRFQSRSYLTCDTDTLPISSLELPPVVHNFILAPTPANRSDEHDCTIILSASPTIPPRAIRRKERSFSNDLDELERPSTRKGKDEGDSTTWIVSPMLPDSKILSIKARSETYHQPKCDNSPVSSPVDEYSAVRDSLASIYSEEDSVPNQLGIASHQQQSIESHLYTSVLKQPHPTILPNFTFPTLGPQPTIHARMKSSGSLKRTYDSLKIEHAKNSSNDSASKGKEMSRDTERQRDQNHFDPKNHRKDGSGGIRGMVADFDNGRRGPFSDRKPLDHRMATRSRSSSISSFHCGYHNRFESGSQPIPAKEGTDEQLSISGASDTNSINTIPTISVGRFRSDSESSMGSISDMYESYLKKSSAKPVPSASALDESGFFDLHVRSEDEQMKYEKAEKERNGLLSASAAVAGVRKKKSPPANLVLDNSNGKRVPRAIESPVSGWRI